MSSRLIYACFFLSGISALIYQVVWVRQFGNIFGNSVYSASIVIAVFMTGLGIGSYLAGRWADRVYFRAPAAPLKAYAWFELLIALFGFLIAIALPHLEGLSASISAYQQNDKGWFVLTQGSLLWRYLIAVCILLPSTMLMGGTLTLLIRHQVGSQVNMAGSKIGMLYGINTLGAACGAWLVDFALIPGIGLFATQSLAVLINLLIAVLILHKTRELQGGLLMPAALEPAHKVVTAISTDLRRMIWLTALAIFLSGFAAMGMEIIWFRVLSSVFGQYRSIFSILLVVILVGIWLGSVSGGYLQQRFGRPVMLYMISQAVFVISAVIGMLLVDVDAVLAITGTLFSSPDAAAHGLAHTRSRYLVLVIGAAIAVGLPAVMMGFAYPLANAHIQRLEAHVGNSSGLLYFANTVGAVAGSVAAGFLLLPGMGSQQAVLLLLAISLVAIIPLYLSTWQREDARISLPHQAVAGSFVLVAIAAIILWSGQGSETMVKKSFSSAERIEERMLASSEGLLETVAVIDNTRFNRGLSLYTNGHSMSSNSFGSQRYMRAFVHVPLLQSPAPSDVLVICFGVGNTLHATTLYPQLDNIEVVDLSENVLDHAGYFHATNHNALLDERVSVYVNDGRQHLRMGDDEKYDLVTLEPPPIVHAGVASLYSREFYALARERMKQGGFLTQWLPYTQTTRELSFAIIRSFVDVFPNAVMLAGSTGDIILMGRKGLPNIIDPDEIAAALKRYPGVYDDMKQINMATLTEFVGSFLATGPELHKLVELDVPAVTDDHPILEYPPAFHRELSAPFEVINVWDVLQWCPGCQHNGELIASLSDLSLYLNVMDDMFENGRYSRGDSAAGLQLSFQTDVDTTSEEFKQVRARLPYLNRIFSQGASLQ